MSKLQEISTTCDAHAAKSVSSARRNLTPARQIIEEEAWNAGVRVADVLGRRRLMEYVRPRHKAMLRIRRELGYSYPRIGRLFNRHHVSVLTCIRKQTEEEARRKALLARNPLERPGS